MPVWTKKEEKSKRKCTTFAYDRDRGFPINYVASETLRSVFQDKWSKNGIEVPQKIKKRTLKRGLRLRNVAP